MKAIIYPNPEGGVCLISPAPGDRLPGESATAQLVRLAKALVPPGVAHQIVESDNLPDRATRAGWALADGKIVVNQKRLDDWKAAQAEKAAR